MISDLRIKLFRLTHRNDTISYVLATDIQDAATKAGPITPGGLDCTDKIERVRKVELTDRAFRYLVEFKGKNHE